MTLLNQNQDILLKLGRIDVPYKGIVCVVACGIVYSNVWLLVCCDAALSKTACGEDEVITPKSRYIVKIG